MKKAFFLSLFLLNSLAAYAQLYVDGVKLDLTNSGAYLEAIIVRRSDRYYVNIDYGQKAKRDDFNEECLTDANNRRYEFKSNVDALNYMFENGWDVQTVYVYNDIRRYLLRRR